MNRRVSSTHREIPWLLLNTSHSPLADFTSPWCQYCSCYSVAALSLVDVVIKSLLRCQTMDMFRHLYRSDEFAYSMLNTAVSISKRLFTYPCLVNVHYCAWEKVTAWIRNILQTLLVAQFFKRFSIFLCFTATIVFQYECSYTLLFNGKWY